jgi:cytochrome bd-type quinol oxidase subunit 1
MSTRKKIFITLLVIIQLGIIWPVYSFFSGIYPMILGLPLSFVWIIVMLLAAFFLLLWYYLSDPIHKQNQPEHKTADN